MHKLLTISCFYHPTTVILVDDDEDFLKRMVQLLNRLVPHIMVKTFSNPNKALEYVNSVKNLPVALTPLFSADDYLPASGSAPFALDVSHIYEQAADPKIFDQISVAVVDYNMPNQMSGEEFCSAIADTHVKRIMLTGEVDAELGVDLLNNGIIDKFLIKLQPDLEEKLAQYIYLMKKTYFQDLSAPLLKNLSPDMCTGLSDPAFVTLFHRICQEYNVVSYYLLDFSCSFLLIDEKGSLAWLIVKTQKDIDEYLDFIQDTEVPDSIVESIKNKEKIPYFYTQKDYMHSIDPAFPLEKYLYPATELIGETPYYYCLAREVHDFPLKKSK